MTQYQLHADLEEEMADRNQAYRLWEDNYERLYHMLFNGVNALAGEAFSRELIQLATLERVTDKTKTFNESERSSKLITFLILRAKEEPNDVFDDLLKSLDEPFFNNVKDFLKKEREKAKCQGNTNPVVAALTISTAKLTDAICGGLQGIAAKLRGRSLTIDQYNMIVDPEQHHTELCLHSILKEIGEGIKHDPSRLSTVIEMLRNMGGYYSDICDVLSDIN